MAKVLSVLCLLSRAPLILSKTPTLHHSAKPAHTTAMSTVPNSNETYTSSPSFNVFDSHLHVWATPEEAAEKYPYFPGQEPPLQGDVDFLLECMEEAGVDGALIVQPINHMFDHSYVTSVLKKYPSKFLGCLLANPADDGSGIKQLEELVIQDDYRAVRFNPYLWPSNQKMTNKVGKALYAKAGELGVPVGFMLFKGLNLHIDEVEELCTEYPDTKVILDHVSFCKPPSNEEEKEVFSSLLQLSRFPQVHIKFSALFRVSRKKPPYEDLAPILSQLLTKFGSDRILWGSDFPYVVPESSYKGALEAAKYLSDKIEKENSFKLNFSLRENNLFSK